MLTNLVYLYGHSEKDIFNWGRGEMGGGGLGVSKVIFSFSYLSLVVIWSIQTLTLFFWIIYFVSEKSKDI